MRRRNKTQANFFVQSFGKTNITTVSDIQDQIRQGKFEVLSKVSYLMKNVMGSDAYYRSKRNELKAFISHHVEAGNGPPNFFITLSCAEFWWPDLIRVVNERIKIATGVEGDLEPNKSGIVEAMNRWTAVVQEFFQLRVQEWLSTVGEKVFDIEHYWIRYEFAPSRGQIHAHMLAICADQHVLKDMHKNRHNKAERTKILSKWATEKLGMTASVSITNVSPEACTEVRVFDKKDHPSGRRYGQARDTKADAQDLLHALQMHTCNGYCMRPSKDTNKDGKRVRACRFGAGLEATPGMCDTQGFDLTEEHRIVSKGNGFQELCLSRNHRRVNQTSQYALCSWRANCDVKIIIYNTDPEFPDTKVIAKLTDYCVSYTCKGSATLKQEVDMNRNFIQGYAATTNDKSDASRLITQVMNKCSTSSIIPLQQIMVILLGLNLVQCSESFQVLSLNGRPLQTGRGRKKKTDVDKYADREQKFADYTLFDFFHWLHNRVEKGNLRHQKKMGKTVKFILHATGVRAEAVYPPNPDYARAMLKLYKPWHGTFDAYEADPVGRFIAFYKSANCPRALAVELQRAEERYFTGRTHAEPVAEGMHCNSEKMSGDDEEFAALISQHQPEGDDFNVGDPDMSKLDFGLDHKWDGPPQDRVSKKTAAVF